MTASQGRNGIRRYVNRKGPSYCQRPFLKLSPVCGIIRRLINHHDSIVATVKNCRRVTPCFKTPGNHGGHWCPGHPGVRLQWATHTMGTVAMATNDWQAKLCRSLQSSFRAPATEAFLTTITLMVLKAHVKLLMLRVPQGQETETPRVLTADASGSNGL